MTSIILYTFQVDSGL